MKKYYFDHQGNFGLQISIDCYDCSAAIIRTKRFIKCYVDELCKLIEMKKFGECQIVHFGADEKVAGFSMTQLIETSLISGHFVNKTNAAYIDIFSCKWFDKDVASVFTQQFFKAKDIKMYEQIRL